MGTYRAFFRWIATRRRTLRAGTVSAPRRKFSPDLSPCRNVPETISEKKKPLRMYCIY